MRQRAYPLSAFRVTLRYRFDGASVEVNCTDCKFVRHRDFTDLDGKSEFFRCMLMDGRLVTPVFGCKAFEPK